MDISFKDAFRKYSTSVFNVMAKPVGPVCNLNCTYCYYLEKKKLYGDVKRFKMSDRVLETFIKQYIESQKSPNVDFVWQGGEPSLIGLDFYKRVVALQNKYNGNKTISNAFQTNGTKLDHEWCRFLADNDFLVGLSIDGPDKLHDKYRVDRKGRGTFSKVMRAVELLWRHKVRFNTLTVVNDYNGHYPLKIYRFLKRIGSQYMQFLPIVEQNAGPNEETPLNLVSPAFQGESRVTSWSVDPRQYGKFLTDIFDEWVKKDVGRYFVQIFDATLANWVNQNPGLCVFQKTCGEASVIEHNGDVYSCDHFVYPENYLGNILETPLIELMKSEKQKDFGLQKEYLLPEQCRKCKFKNICNGGCPKNRVIPAKETNHRLNYLCKGYYSFFSHVVPYMNFMANELKHQRPPANVMQLANMQR